MNAKEENIVNVLLYFSAYKQPSLAEKDFGIICTSIWPVLKI